MILIVANLAFTGCASQIHYNGFNFEHADFEVIKVGKTNLIDVLNELGSPTTESDFGEKKLYYISRRVEKTAFFDPKLLEQKVLIIGFNKKDVISDITELTLDNANKIVFAENFTEIKGNNLTVVEQFLTNIGKFKPKK